MGRGKSTIEAMDTNVLGNGSGELGGLRRLGADAVSDIGGADVDVEAGKQLEGGLLAGGVAEGVAAEVELRRGLIRLAQRLKNQTFREQNLQIVQLAQRLG